MSRAEVQKNVDAVCTQLNLSGTSAWNNFTASAVGIGSDEVFSNCERVKEVDLGWIEASGKILKSGQANGVSRGYGLEIIFLLLEG